jgi:hypothetical protein
MKLATLFVTNVMHPRGQLQLWVAKVFVKNHKDSRFDDVFMNLVAVWYKNQGLYQPGSPK